MALINKTTIIQDTIRTLKKCSNSSGVGLFSYKRNRKVYLLQTEDDLIIIKEEGYITQERSIPFAKLEKELRTIIKREFPRSRKIRLYKLEEEMNDLQYQKI